MEPWMIFAFLLYLALLLSAFKWGYDTGYSNAGNHSNGEEGK